MFRCHNCGKNSEARDPLNKLVTERRKRSYERPIFKGRGEFRRQVDSETVYGWEIVKEIFTCPSCYTAFTGKEVKKKEEPIIEVAPPVLPEVPRKKLRSESRRAPIVEIINPLVIVR